MLVPAHTFLPPPPLGASYSCVPPPLPLPINIASSACTLPAVFGGLVLPVPGLRSRPAPVDACTAYREGMRVPHASTRCVSGSGSYAFSPYSQPLDRSVSSCNASPRALEGIQTAWPLNLAQGCHMLILASLLLIRDVPPHRPHAASRPLLPAKCAPH